MTLKLLRYIIVLGILLAIVNNWSGLCAQNPGTDSLRILIKTDKPDTNKVKHLYVLAWNYFHKGEYDSGLHYNSQALNLAEKLYFKKGVSVAYSNTGFFYQTTADYANALEYYFKALKIDEAIKNKNGIARDIGSIGNIYWLKGDYKKALEYYEKALRLSDTLGNKSTSAVQLANIGNIYFKDKDFKKAREYYSKALDIGEKQGDDYLIANMFGNIGSTYSELGNNKMALIFCFKALELSKKNADNYGVINHHIALGQIYTAQKEYKNAYDYLMKARVFADSVNAKNEQLDLYESLGTLYEKSSVPLPDSTGSKILNAEQMRLHAIAYYKRSVEIKNAILDEETKKKLVQNEMNYEFDKKEAAAKAEQEKKDVEMQAGAKRQNFIIILVSSLLLVVFLFALFIFRSLRITRRQKHRIEISSSETQKQKKIIEEKNRSITDSIKYAKRIQQALLREEEHVSMHLPEHFILFLPKDIVSGDFYWGTEKGEYWYFVAADCTGHGVPGAIMSMLGIAFLNDIILSEVLLTPAEILDRLRERVIKELRQTDETIENKDGMDISLCRLNLKTKELQWAGANNALYLIRNGNQEKIKADKQPIGYHPESKPFTNHEFKLCEGDSIYIYTDGYADQFGGPQEKKLGFKKMENLFIIHNHRPMKEQKATFNKRFMEWKGQQEQTDDVCIFGVRV
ncbi:MAG: tetratricopeptide repeat protein [Bacteroidia bacterium]